MSKQNIRRAGARWREEAPEFFVDAFDLGEKFADRYTIIVLPVLVVILVEDSILHFYPLNHG